MSKDEASFWGMVEANEEGCLLWTGRLKSGGYGETYWQGKQRRVHRIAYELCIGPIPDGLQIDHLCRVRNCVNPGHLEVVDQRTNILRGESPSAKHSRSKQCPYGHPYDRRRPNGWRICSRCRDDSIKRLFERDPSRRLAKAAQQRARRARERAALADEATS